MKLQPTMKPHPCLFCRSKETGLVPAEAKGYYFVRCVMCLAQGPTHLTPRGALRAWDRTAEQVRQQSQALREAENNVQKMAARKPRGRPRKRR